jgi:protease-4
VEEILLQLFDTAVSAIAKGRSLAPERIKRLVDQGPFTAAHALAHRLIDGVADAEELESLLAGKGEKKARFRPLASYGGPMLQLLRSELKPLLPAPQIGVVSVDGVIKIGENVHLPFAPRAAGSDSVVEALRRARESDRVKAIVLAIDSRGGSFLASELIFRAVRRAAQAKPVVAYFDRAAASGGYLAAVGANYIVAGPGALTGSIGIFGGKFELSRLLERLGVGRAEIELGKNAGVYSTLKPWSESERAALDALLESNYRDFVSAVAVARHLSADAVARCAEGRVFTGQRARELGLVDEVGSFEDAVALAARLAQISGTPEVESWDMPVHALSAIAGLHGWADVAKLIQPLEAERVFAAAESWLEIEPRP